jgi:hypothetical protein
VNRAKRAIAEVRMTYESFRLLRGNFRMQIRLLHGFPDGRLDGHGATRLRHAVTQLIRRKRVGVCVTWALGWLLEAATLATLVAYSPRHSQPFKPSRT